MKASRPTLSTTRTLRRLVSRAIVLALAGVIAVPMLLAAHAHLRRSEPAARERLATSPPAIRLWFSENPQLAFTHVRLRAADSSDVPLGSLTLASGDPSGVVAPLLGALPNGAYTVHWQTGGADGHPVRGSFSFSVAAAAVAAAAPPSAADSGQRPPREHAIARLRRPTEPPTLNAYVAARWVELVALLAVLGAIVFRALALRVLRAPETEVAVTALTDGARRFALAALVLGAAGALARLYAESALVVADGGIVDAASVKGILTTTTWGAGWITGFAGLIVAAIGFTLARRKTVGWMLAGVGALAMAVTPALTGHAAATPPRGVSVTADVIHAVAAGAWLGTLLLIVLVGMPALRARTDAQAAAPELGALVRAFHPLALICAGAVVLTGLATSWLRFPSVASLWESVYGRVLLLKVALVVIVAVLGALNWRRLLPGGGEGDGARAFRRTAGAELAFAALVLFATALLGSIATPEHQPTTTGTVSAPGANP